MYKYIIVGAMVLGQNLFAQEKLSLKEAVDIAKKNNQGIIAAKQGVEYSQMQVYKANAGMGPIVNMNGSMGSALNRVKQSLSNGTEIIRPNGWSVTPNTNVALAWTLYDGHKMNAVYQRLSENVRLSERRSENTQNQIVAAVSRAYVEIQKQKKVIASLKGIIKYYQERKQIAEERWTVGRGSKLDFLQTSVDLNNQTSELIRAENALVNYKTTLNGILERDLALDFDVDALDSNERLAYSLDEFKEKAKEQNPEFQISKQGIQISRIFEKEALAAKMPRVFLNSSYGFALNRSNAGFILLNQNLGLNTAIGAQWNIFNGHQTQKNIESAKLNTLILETQKDDLWSGIASAIRKAYQQYQTDAQVLSLEKENVTLAEENLKIALEKFKMGASTILELNQAQQSYDLAINKIILSEYALRLNEIELKRLSGLL